MLSNTLEIEIDNRIIFRFSGIVLVIYKTKLVVTNNAATRSDFA